jgi:hypothetical protein
MVCDGTVGIIITCGVEANLLNLTKIFYLIDTKKSVLLINEMGKG